MNVILAGVSFWRILSPRGVRSSSVGQTGLEQILVIRLDAIGDLVMSTLVFRELKRQYPKSRVTAVVQQQGRSLIETNPFIDRIISPNGVHKARFLYRFRQDLAMLRMYFKLLRNENFSLVMNPRAGADLYSADVLIALIGCRRTFKYEDNSMKGPANLVKKIAFRHMVSLPRKSAQHEVHSNIAITERLTGQPCTSVPEVFISESDLAAATLLAPLSPNTTIVSVAFNAQARKRAWPLESWARVLDQLSRDHPIFALIICAQAEQANGNQLLKMLSVPGSLISGASLLLVAAAIRQSDLFIGPDSGLAHLAAAVNCPVLVVSPHPLDGDPDHGNSPLRFGPFSTRSRVIQPAHGIPPCTDGCDALESHCILQVDIDHVTAACAELLSTDYSSSHMSHNSIQQAMSR